MRNPECKEFSLAEMLEQERAELIPMPTASVMVLIPRWRGQGTQDQARPQGQMEEGVTVPAAQVYDLVLQAVGHTPNGWKIAADKAGVAVTDRGFINVHIQMHANISHIFAIGDVVCQPMLAHKAVHEARVEAEVIAGELLDNKELTSAAFNTRVISSVAYTELEVAWVGLTEDYGLARMATARSWGAAWSAIMLAT